MTFQVSETCCCGATFNGSASVVISSLREDLDGFRRAHAGCAEAFRLGSAQVAQVRKTQT